MNAKTEDSSENARPWLTSGGRPRAAIAGADSRPMKIHLVDL
ncbi:hypothetical protein [Paraburkholderia youngii]